MLAFSRLTLEAQRGSIVLVGLVFAALITLLGMAFFTLANVESRLAVDRETRTQALYTAETGLQQAWYEMKHGANTFDTVYASTFASGATVVTGTLNGLSYTVTKVDSPTVDSPTTPGCDSLQCVRVQSTGHGQPSVGAPAGNQAVIQAVFSRGSGSVFRWGAFGLGSLTTKTSTLIIAYDSTLGCATPPCPYTPTDPDGGGPLTENTLSTVTELAGSNGNISNTSNNNPADGIHGDAIAGGTYSGGGYISGTPTSGAPQVAYPSEELPQIDPCGPPYSDASSLTLAGSSSYSASTGALSISSGGTVTLNRGTTYCFSTFTMLGGALQLGSTGTDPVIVYLTGKMDIKSGTILNTTNDPTQLQFYSSCSGTGCVSFSAGGQSYMTIYDPEGDIRMSGSALVDGAVIGNNVLLDGSAELHYDMGLRSSTTPSPFSVWNRTYWSLISS
jgi:Tfp pilus assembly protein PilX